MKRMKNQREQMHVEALVLLRSERKSWDGTPLRNSTCLVILSHARDWEKLERLFFWATGSVLKKTPTWFLDFLLNLPICLPLLGFKISFI